MWIVLTSSFQLQLHVQSVPITTKIVSSNPVHGEVYSIQTYLIKFVSDSTSQWFSQPIKPTTTI